MFVFYTTEHSLSSTLFNSPPFSPSPSSSSKPSKPSLITPPSPSFSLSLSLLTHPQDHPPHDPEDSFFWIDEGSFVPVRVRGFVHEGDCQSGGQVEWCVLEWNVNVISLREKIGVEVDDYMTRQKSRRS